MEKTYYRKLVFHEGKGGWVCKFEFSDDPEGFFMPMIFEGDTRTEVEQKFEEFIGINAEKIAT